VGGSNEVDRLNGWIGTASSPTLLYLIKFGSSTYDLYYVAVPGGVPGTPTLLQGNASNNSTRGLEAAYASPDGKTLAIRAGSLFFSDISSGTPTTPTAVLAGVSGYTWSPDSQFVIANSTANGPRELYTVSATGSAVIYPDFISDVAGWDYDFAPDGKRVWVKDTGANLEALGFLIDLSSPTPGAPEQFSPDPNLQSASGGLATGAPVGNDGRTVVFSPDSTMLAYSFRDNDANEMILYLNDVTGGVLGAPQPITPGLAYTPVANDGATRATWTSDSRFLFMRGNWDARSPYRVYSYDPRSPAPQLRDLTPLLPNGAKGITEFAIRE
jgi:WD40 repeat protein